MCIGWEIGKDEGTRGWKRSFPLRRARRRKEVASLLAMARDRWRWALSSPPPLVPAVIHHLGLFFTYFICNIFRNFYSVNQPPPPPPPLVISIRSRPHKTASRWTIIPARNREKGSSFYPCRPEVTPTSEGLRKLALYMLRNLDMEIRS